jgi:predicted NBD/HSP70 family sugar kinase
MKTADPELMRAINRFHVMDVIRRFGPISRTEISQHTELSAATVSAITAALLEDRLISARPFQESAEAGRGRPRVMLILNSGAAHVAGVKLAPHSISVAVTDFVAEPLATLTMPVRCARQPLSVIADIVEDGVRHCVADAGLSLAQINGICVGVPGIVDRTRGVCWRSPIFGPEPVAFCAALAERLDVESKVESAAHLVALAEHWFGQGKGLDDFVVVTLEATVGVGIVHAGELYRSGVGVSADLGWEPVTAPARAGAVGAALAPSEADRPAAERDAGVNLGRTLARLAGLLGPPRLIVTGDGVRAGQPFLDAMRQVFESAITPALRGRVELVVHDADDHFWARGAAALVLRELYGAPWNTTGPRILKPELRES